MGGELVLKALGWQFSRMMASGTRSPKGRFWPTLSFAIQVIEAQSTSTAGSATTTVTLGKSFNGSGPQLLLLQNGLVIITVDIFRCFLHARHFFFFFTEYLSVLSNSPNISFSSIITFN